MGPVELLQRLSGALVLGSLLEELRQQFGGYELVDHWQQGEFHHDVVMRVPGATPWLGGEFLVVATNCNGGVKEVLAFAALPSRLALWHFRCPENPEFAGTLPPLLGAAVTEHWFDPCELLTQHARSEYRAEFRERQCGGGLGAAQVAAAERLLSCNASGDASRPTRGEPGRRTTRRR